MIKLHNIYPCKINEQSFLDNQKKKKLKKNVGIFSSLGRIRIRFSTKRIRGSGAVSKSNGSDALDLISKKMES